MNEEALANTFNVEFISALVSYDGHVRVARTNDPWLSAMSRGGQFVVG